MKRASLIVLLCLFSISVHAQTADRLRGGGATAPPTGQCLAGTQFVSIRGDGTSGQIWIGAGSPCVWKKASDIPEATVATRPTVASSTRHPLIYFTDGASATDCTSGGGSTKVLCLYNGSAWVVVGGTSGTVTSVSGTANQIGSTGGATPVISLVAGVIPYDVATQVTGKPDASAVILKLVAVRSFTISASGHKCFATTGATAQADFIVGIGDGTTQVTKDTLRFAAAGVACSIVGGTSVTVTPGQVLTITAPAQDATLADFGITLSGVLVLP